MNVKKAIKRLFAVVVLLALSVTAAIAQDLIVKQDGETIKGYRTDVGKTAVYYQMEDNDETPILSIPKSDVLIIKMQNGTKIVIDEAESMTKTNQTDIDNESTDYIPLYPLEPVADPETISKAEIGSLIEFYDGTKGIVFYLDGNGHGLAVYLYEDRDLMCWQSVFSWGECVDIRGIPNEDISMFYWYSPGIDPYRISIRVSPEEDDTKVQMGLGDVYCNAAIKEVGIDKLPAIKWCHSIGSGWYLPSFSELYELVVIANLSKGSYGPISKALKKAGGHKLLGTKSYFSSSEDDNTNVFSIHPTDGIAIAKKYHNHACRAVRMF